MAQPGSGPPPAVRTFLDWLRVRVGPAAMTALLLLAGYHLMWVLSESRYDTLSLAVVIGAAVVVATALGVAQALGFATSSILKAFLLTAGVAAAILAIIIYSEIAERRLTNTIKIASVVVLVVGILVTIAAFYLHPGEELTADHPSHVEQREIQLAGRNCTALLRTFRGYGGRGIDRILASVEGQVSTEDLHYVGYHVEGECWFSLDVLADADLPTDDKVSPERRRAQYLRHGLKLNRLMVGLNQEFRSIDSGILLRVVLDVERGALYYYWIDDVRFLIGVTVDQSQVHKADQKMVQLVDAIRPLLGHKRIEDLNR